jgi:SEC-C motif-containing protein
MCARYSAHALRLPTYLLASWHASTRPDSVDTDDGLQWTGLQIHEHNSVSEHEATVTFSAFFRTADNKPGSLQEQSRFVHEDGRWWYLDGERPKRAPQRRRKTGRNAPCPCGSGKKYKHCCGG